MSCGSQGYNEFRNAQDDRVPRTPWNGWERKTSEWGVESEGDPKEGMVDVPLSRYVEPPFAIKACQDSFLNFKHVNSPGNVNAFIVHCRGANAAKMSNRIW